MIRQLHIIKKSASSSTDMVLKSEEHVHVLAT